MLGVRPLKEHNMSRVLFVRSPEASFRPEMYISNAIIAEFVKRGAEVVEINSSQRFTSLRSQSMFYDDQTMTDSFAMALTEVGKSVKTGDAVFFGDGWCPTLPALEFHLHCSGIRDVRKYGIFHSSCATPGDFLATAGDWVSRLEADIVGRYLDTTFVATPYSVDTLKANLWFQKLNIAVDERVTVSGLPLSMATDPAPLPRNREVIFAHRWAADKNPQAFASLACAAKDQNVGAKFIVLHPIPIDTTIVDSTNIEYRLCSTREQYEDNIRQASVVFSSATLETFGYALIEGVQNGALPLAPARACYPYLYGVYNSPVDHSAKFSPFLYEDGATTNQVLDKLKVLLDNPQLHSKLTTMLDYYSQSATRIVDKVLGDFK